MMRAGRFTRVCAAVALAAILLLVSQAPAGVVSYILLGPDTADADSGIDPSNYYVQALDFGTSGAANVNGVQFTAVGTGNVDAISGFQYSVSTSGRNQHGGNAPTGVLDTQGIYAVVQDMMYNGNNAPGGVATLTLTGLVPGFEYDARIYNRDWGASALRRARWEFDTDGIAGAEDVIEDINQDDASEIPPSEGTFFQDSVYALSYQFTADSDTLTIDLTQENQNYS